MARHIRLFLVDRLSQTGAASSHLSKDDEARNDYAHDSSVGGRHISGRLAQVPAERPAGGPTFEVVSIKMNTSGALAPMAAASGPMAASR
jgi:hypothetical protein